MGKERPVAERPISGRDDGACTKLRPLGDGGKRPLGDGGKQLDDKESRRRN